MKAKKLNLSQLKVESFITALPGSKKEAVIGGTYRSCHQGCTEEVILDPGTDTDYPEPFSEGCTGWECTNAGCTPAGSDVCYP